MHLCRVVLELSFYCRQEHILADLLSRLWYRRSCEPIALNRCHINSQSCIISANISTMRNSKSKCCMYSRYVNRNMLGCSHMQLRVIHIADAATEACNMAVCSNRIITASHTCCARALQAAVMSHMEDAVRPVGCYNRFLATYPCCCTRYCFASVR
jgi:hypothetical protein